jgi:Holliday junction resolvasome RuvABC ATP-dependent DNA helicase subunit
MEVFSDCIKGQTLAVAKVGAYLNSLVAATRQDRYVVLKGGPMTGKTTVAKAAAVFLERKFEMVQADRINEIEDLLESVGRKVGSDKNI